MRRNMPNNERNQIKASGLHKISIKGLCLLSSAVMLNVAFGVYLNQRCQPTTVYVTKVVKAEPRQITVSKPYSHSVARNFKKDTVRPIVKRKHVENTRRGPVKQLISDNDAANASTPIELCSRLRDAIEGNRPDLSIYIGARLSAMGTEAVADLVNLVNSSEPKVASEAYRILCRINSIEGNMAAIELLATCSDKNLAKEFSSHLASTRDAALIELLANMAGSVENGELKSNIGMALSGMDGESVVNSLARLSSESNSDAEAMEYATQLASLNKPSNTKALESILASSNDPMVTQAAALAIANIGNKESLDILVIYAEQDGANRDAYVDALTSVSSPYGQSTLFEIAKYHPSSDMRASAATALANYNSSDVQRELEQVYHAETDAAVQEVISHSIEVLDQVTAPQYVYDPDAAELVEMSS